MWPRASSLCCRGLSSIEHSNTLRTPGKMQSKLLKQRSSNTSSAVKTTWPGPTSWSRSLKRPSKRPNLTKAAVFLTPKKSNKRGQTVELWRWKKERIKSYTSSASKPVSSLNFKSPNSAQMKTTMNPTSLISSPTDWPSPITNTTSKPKFSSLTSTRIKTRAASADSLQMETHLRLWLGTTLLSHPSPSKTIMVRHHLTSQGIRICLKHRRTVAVVARGIRPYLAT